MDKFLEDIIISILAADSVLATIPPRNSLTTDDEEKGALSLTIHAELDNADLVIVGEFNVSITLARQYEQTESQAFEELWARVINQIDNPPANLPVYSEFSRLDLINKSSTSGIEGNSFNRKLTFTALIQG